MIKKSEMKEKNKAAKEEVIDKNVEEEANLEEKVSTTNKEHDKDTEVEEKIKIAKEAVLNKKAGEVDLEKIPTLHFKDLQFPNIEDNSKSSNKRASDFSIVNNKNGRRVVFGYEVSSYLGFPDKLQLGFQKNTIAIAEKFPGNKNSFTTKKSKNERKLIIYNKELIEHMTNLYGLDFEGRTTISFYDAEFTTIQDTKVVLITIKEEK